MYYDVIANIVIIITFSWVTLGQLMTLHTLTLLREGFALTEEISNASVFVCMMMFLSTLSSSSPISATVTLGQLMTLHSGLF